jgi:hypothetical protein
MELLGTLPKPMLKRITPATAAGALVDGLESRSTRVVRPGLWRPVSALRGVVGPLLDDRYSRDRRILDVLARLDARRATTPRVVAASKESA